MATITTPDIKAYTVARLDAKASPAEINRELAALKRMFNLAIAAGLLLTKPHIPMLREDNVRTGFFERDQLDAGGAHLPAPVAAAVRFAGYTGWRIRSEVLTLQWKNVDFVAGVVTLDVGTTKNKDGRTYPIAAHPELRALLEEQRRYTDEQQAATERIIPLVLHRAGRPIRDFRSVWRSATVAAGCPGRIVHDLRRTAVRDLERAGVSRSVAMRLTGHKTMSVYSRYAIVSPADLAEGVAKVAAKPRGSLGEVASSATISPIRRSS
jgi:integrase